MSQVRSLPEYRELLQTMAGGTMPVALGLEMLAAAEAEIEQAQGEFTIAQAVERSGRSRSWFERRLEGWAANGLARKPGVEWLVKAAAIPARVHTNPHGFDPALSDEAILAKIAADDRAGLMARGDDLRKAFEAMKAAGWTAGGYGHAVRVFAEKGKLKMRYQHATSGKQKQRTLFPADSKELRKRAAALALKKSEEMRQETAIEVEKESRGWEDLTIFDVALLYMQRAPGFPAWIFDAEAYGGDERDELNARTGCIGCPLTDKDTALDALIRRPEWEYLAPLKELRRLWRALRLPEHRHRKHGGETRQDGSLVENQYRMGPITLASRAWALEVVLDIQARVNAGAAAAGRPPVDILNQEEVDRIREMHADRVFPNKWSGDEPLASEFFSEAGDLFAAVEAR